MAGLLPSWAMQFVFRGGMSQEKMWHMFTAFEVEQSEPGVLGAEKDNGLKVLPPSTEAASGLSSGAC